MFVTVRLLHCDPVVVTGSSGGNSLSACGGKAASIHPSLDPTVVGASCIGLTLFCAIELKIVLSTDFDSDSAMKRGWEDKFSYFLEASHRLKLVIVLLFLG